MSSPLREFWNEFFLISILKWVLHCAGNLKWVLIIEFLCKQFDISSYVSIFGIWVLMQAFWHGFLCKHFGMGPYANIFKMRPYASILTWDLMQAFWHGSFMQAFWHETLCKHFGIWVHMQAFWHESLCKHFGMSPLLSHLKTTPLWRRFWNFKQNQCVGRSRSTQIFRKFMFQIQTKYMRKG